LPEFSFKKDILYCRPKQKAPADNESPWYNPVPVGKSKLGNLVRDMCDDAEIPHKTNHSLHATGTSFDCSFLLCYALYTASWVLYTSMVFCTLLWFGWGLSSNPSHV